MKSFEELSLKEIVDEVQDGFILGIPADYSGVPMKFTKELIKKVKVESSKGFTLSFELTAKAHRLGYKIIEIPTVWIERNKGVSRFKITSFLFPYIKWLFYIINTSIFYRNEK